MKNAHFAHSSYHQSRSYSEHSQRTGVVKLKVSKLEQETVVVYNEEESTATVYTHNKVLIRKLNEANVIGVQNGSAQQYIIPKSWVKVVPKRKKELSDEQRKQLADRARKNLHGSS